MVEGRKENETMDVILARKAKDLKKKWTLIGTAVDDEGKAVGQTFRREDGSFVVALDEPVAPAYQYLLDD
jgi:hypothetical protein